MFNLLIYTLYLLHTICLIFNNIDDFNFILNTLVANLIIIFANNNLDVLIFSEITVIIAIFILFNERIKIEPHKFDQNKFVFTSALFISIVFTTLCNIQISTIYILILFGIYYNYVIFLMNLNIHNNFFEILPANIALALTDVPYKLNILILKIISLILINKIYENYFLSIYLFSMTNLLIVRIVQLYNIFNDKKIYVFRNYEQISLFESFFVPNIMSIFIDMQDE